NRYSKSKGGCWRQQAPHAWQSYSGPFHKSGPPQTRCPRLLGRDAAVVGLLVPATAAGAAPSAAVPPAAAAAAAILARLGLVDGELAAVHLLAAQGGDGGLGLLVGAHLHEAEALGAVRVPVHDHLRRLHGAEGREHLLQVAAGDAI